MTTERGQLIWVCETCGKKVLIHRGEVRMVSFQRLPELLLQAATSCKCEVVRN